MKQFLLRRWFLLGLIASIVLGFSCWKSLSFLPRVVDTTPLVAGVIFCMAAPLDAAGMWSGLRRPKAVIIAVFVNFVLLPPAAWACAGLLSPMTRNGLIVCGCIPSTLASAAVLTRRAGGKDSIALLVMMITNLSCFVVTPAWLQTLTGATVKINFVEIAWHLVLIVVVPVVAAQTLRGASRPWGRWASKQKIAFGVVAQLGLLFVVLLGAIKGGAAIYGEGASAIPTRDWVAMPLVVVALHVAALGVAVWLARLFRLPRDEQPAVAFSGSQKTLMVGLDLAVDFFPTAPILPLILYHVGQLLLDSFVADSWGAAATTNADVKDSERSSR